MTTKTIQEMLNEKIKENLGMTVSPVDETPEPEVKLADVIPTITKKDNQKTFEEIIGIPHPKIDNTRVFFTVYDKSDWDADVQEYIPEVNPNFTEFDLDYALAILMGIEHDKPILAYGPPGTGKSVTPEQICARINYPYMFIQGMGGTDPSDYIGSQWADGGSMSWKDGPAALAVRKGVFLLYDEPFKSSAQTNMCFQSLLDSRRALKLYGHPTDTHLKAHPKFRMALADNVRGVGDGGGMYAAEVQDQSTLNRCSLKVKVGYPSKETEQAILSAIAPSLPEKMVKDMVSLASRLRDGWSKGTISLPFTLRDTQEWVRQTELLGDPKFALNLCWLNGIDGDSDEGAGEHAAVIELVDMYSF